MKDKLSAMLAWGFGGLVMLGGIMGYAIAGSWISLGSGLAFGTLMMASGSIMARGPLFGRCLGLLTSSALTVVFYMRFVKTLAWIPSGTLAILGLATTIGLALLWPRQIEESEARNQEPEARD